MINFVKTAFVVLGLSLPVSAYCEPLANIQITAEEQRVCGPDVVRLCGDMLPDVSRVLGCMQSKRSQVSPACTKVARARGL